VQRGDEMKAVENELQLQQIVAQLREILTWLDDRGLALAAIDVNSALEKLEARRISQHRATPH